MTDYFKYKKIITCKDTGEVCVGYRKYLESKHWMLLRKLLVKKDSRCAICNEITNNLQLHHLSYERIGFEKEMDLLILCDSCHKLVHENGLKKIPKSAIQNSETKRKRFKRVCENCRSFSVIKYCGKMRPYCRYHSKLTERKRNGCPKFYSKRR